MNKDATHDNYNQNTKNVDNSPDDEMKQNIHNNQDDTPSRVDPTRAPQLRSANLCAACRGLVEGNGNDAVGGGDDEDFEVNGSVGALSQETQSTNDWLLIAKHADFIKHDEGIESGNIQEPIHGDASLYIEDVGMVPFRAIFVALAEHKHCTCPHHFPSVPGQLPDGYMVDAPPDTPEGLASPSASMMVEPPSRQRSGQSSGYLSPGMASSGYLSRNISLRDFEDFATLIGARFAAVHNFIGRPLPLIDVPVMLDTPVLPETPSGRYYSSELELDSDDESFGGYGESEDEGENGE